VCKEGKAGLSGQLLRKGLPTATLPAEVMTHLAPFALLLSFRVLPLPTRHLAGPTGRALFPVPFRDGEREGVIARATGPAAGYHSDLPSVARRWVLGRKPHLRYADAIARIAPAAPPPRQWVVSGGENEHDRVLEGKVLRHLWEHPEGLPPASLQALLDAPRERVNEVLGHLAEEHKVRRDEEHNLYLPEE
jgi:hypothetical protein